MNSRAIIAALACALGISLGTAADAATLQVYSYAVSAQSSISTHGPTATFGATYPGGFSGKIAPPTDGIAPADEHYVSGTSGTIATSSSATGGGNSVWGLWSSTSSGGAWASFGALGVAAATSAVGGGDNNSLQGAQAFATARDTFTITGGDGAAVFRPTFTVDGTFANNLIALQLELDYRVNDGPTLLAYRIQDNGTGLSLYSNGYVDSLPGLTVTANSVTGAAQVSFDVSFVFGTPFDLTTALYAGAVPFRLGNTDGSVDFLSTARMTGISILQGGNPLVDFAISSGSGTSYGAQGAAVPLPAGGWLFATAFTLVGVWRRRIHC